MMTILIFIALTGVFAVPARGDSLEDVEASVQKSVAKINDYGGKFHEELIDKFDNLEQDAMEGVYDTADKVSDLVHTKEAEASEKGIDARSCTETLSADLDEIVNSVHPKLRACEDPSITFASKFMPFINFQGYTGELILKALAITAKNLAEVPNEAEKCYKKFDFYATSTSFSYEKTSEILKEGLDYLQDFLKGDAERCFQRPVVHSKRDLEAVGQRAISCIDQQINQH